MKTSTDWIEVRILQESLKDSLEDLLKDSTSAGSNGFIMNLIIESTILDLIKTSLDWIQSNRSRLDSSWLKPPTAPKNPSRIPTLFERIRNNNFSFIQLDWSRSKILFSLVKPIQSKIHSSKSIHQTTNQFVNEFNFIHFYQRLPQEEEEEKEEEEETEAEGIENGSN